MPADSTDAWHAPRARARLETATHGRFPRGPLGRAACTTGYTPPPASAPHRRPASGRRMHGRVRPGRVGTALAGVGAHGGRRGHVPEILRAPSPPAARLPALDVPGRLAPARDLPSGHRAPRPTSPGPRHPLVFRRRTRRDGVRLLLRVGPGAPPNGGTCPPPPEVGGGCGRPREPVALILADRRRAGSARVASGRRQPGAGEPAGGVVALTRRRGSRRHPAG